MGRETTRVEVTLEIMVVLNMFDCSYLYSYIQWFDDDDSQCRVQVVIDNASKR